MLIRNAEEENSKKMKDKETVKKAGNKDLKTKKQWWSNGDE